MLIALIAVFGPHTAPTAYAHATLLETSPADDATVSELPAKVALRFDEPVSLSGGDARVLDDAGALVSGEATVRGEEVTIPVAGSGGGGTYTVTYRIVSTDSHPIGGAFVFHVGAPSSSVVAPESLSAGDDRWPIVLSTNVLTAVAYGSSLLAVGGWWFARLLARHRLGSVADESWRRFVTQCAVLGVVAVIAALPGRLARLGGAGSLDDTAFLTDSLRGPLGASLVVVCAGLGLVLVAARWRARSDAVKVDVLGSAAGLLALSGFALEGHTRSMRPTWAMIGFDMIHLSAAALWVGGIAGLIVSFRSRPEPQALTGVVRRFSNAAVASVAAVSAAGVGMSLIIIDSVSALTSTGYGLALITKVALVAVVVAMGGYNRRRLVPAMSAGAAAAPAWTHRRLGHVLCAELVVLAAVAGATAVLVTRSPVEATDPTESPPVEISAPLSGGHGQTTITVAPAATGSNSISVTLDDNTGRRLRPLEPPTLDLTQAERGVGPIDIETHRARTGFEADADLAVPGHWKITVRVRIDDFESATATVTLEIADSD